MELTDRVKQVGSILVTQLISSGNSEAPYDALAERYNLKIDFRSFTEVRPVSAKDFRRQRITLDECSAVIFTSKSAVDHFFRMCEEMRHKVSTDMKYFCLSEVIAAYLQRYTTYRKRKVFHGSKSTWPELLQLIIKNKKKERFILPCSNTGKGKYTAFLKKEEIDFEEALMYETVSSDLSDLENVFYDVIIFFSPLGLKALYENFPNFKQNATRIAAFGDATMAAAKEQNLILDISAGSRHGGSNLMSLLEDYVRKANKVGENL